MVSTFAESHVLEYFQCPFQDGDQQSCSYHVHFQSLFQNRCPFGHKNLNSDNPQQQLRELPHYICFSYLTNGCRNAVSSNVAGGCADASSSASSTTTSPPSLQPNANSGALRGDHRSSSSSINSLPRCTEGFHPPIEDLVDLEQLHQKMAFHILSGDAARVASGGRVPKPSAAIPLPPPPTSGNHCTTVALCGSPMDATDTGQCGLLDFTEAKGGKVGASKKEEEEEVEEDARSTTSTLHAEDQCCVCLESVGKAQQAAAAASSPTIEGIDANRLFGLAEGCDHVFCSDCLLTWCEGRIPVGNRNTRKCPTCRVETGKVLVAQRLPKSAAEKEKLFAQQYKCLSICRHSMTPSMHSSTDESVSSGASSSDDDDFMIGDDLMVFNPEAGGAGGGGGGGRLEEQGSPVLGAGWQPFGLREILATRDDRFVPVRGGRRGMTAAAASRGGANRGAAAVDEAGAGFQTRRTRRNAGGGSGPRNTAAANILVFGELMRAFQGGNDERPGGAPERRRGVGGGAGAGGRGNGRAANVLAAAGAIARIQAVEAAAAAAAAEAAVAAGEGSGSGSSRPSAAEQSPSIADSTAATHGSSSRSSEDEEEEEEIVNEDEEDLAAEID